MNELSRKSFLSVNKLFWLFPPYSPTMENVSVLCSPCFQSLWQSSSRYSHSDADSNKLRRILKALAIVNFQQAGTSQFYGIVKCFKCYSLNKSSGVPTIRQEVFLALGIEHTNNERWNQDKKCINGRCQREKLTEVNWKYKIYKTRRPLEKWHWGKSLHTLLHTSYIF